MKKIAFIFSFCALSAAYLGACEDSDNSQLENRQNIAALNLGENVFFVEYGYEVGTPAQMGTPAEAQPGYPAEQGTPAGKPAEKGTPADAQPGYPAEQGTPAGTPAEKGTPADAQPGYPAEKGTPVGSPAEMGTPANGQANPATTGPQVK